LFGGLAPIPEIDVRTTSLTISGSSFAEAPAEPFTAFVEIAVDVVADDSFYGASIDFALMVRTTDSYGGAMSEYELPFEHVITASYKNPAGLVLSSESILAAEGTPPVGFSVALISRPVAPVTIQVSSPFSPT